MNSPVVKINERGHFIGSASCRWFLHHHVGEYCVSTIGDYHPHTREYGVVAPTKKPQPLGIDFDERGHVIDKFYETMIFKLVEHCEEGGEECNCPHGNPPEFWQRRYITPEEAEMSHLAAVENIEAGTWEPEHSVMNALRELIGLDEGECEWQEEAATRNK